MEEEETKEECIKEESHAGEQVPLSANNVENSSDDVLYVKNNCSNHIYTYEAQWLIYALGYSWRPDKPFRFGIGSFIEDQNNKVQIIQLDDDESKFKSQCTFDHNYPPTKLMWIPDSVTF